MKNRFTLRLILGLLAVGFMSVGTRSQARQTSEADYNGTFMYAVSETNSAYPVIFKVETEEFVNGKLVKKSTETVENESQLHERSTKTIVEGGKNREVYEILIGSENGFCKEGNGDWRRSKYVCLGPSVLFIPRPPESVKYSVEDKKIDGKNIKVYTKHSVFSAGNKNGEGKTYTDEVATVNSDGYFVSVITTEGSLDSKTVTRIQKETWITKAKIEPIVAPIK